MIVATGNQEHRLRNLEVGEVALYDKNGTVIKLAANGDISIVAGSGNITIAAKSGDALVKITGNLQVTGEITRGQGTSDQVTLGKHTHSGVQTGGGQTEMPDPGT